MLSPSPTRILIADDSRSVRESVVAMLSELTAVQITAVENGAQALKEACMGGYALLVCDIEMPVMNGTQLLRMLRSQFFSSHELPIIMLTHLHQPEQKVRAFADGANDYVTKPVEPQELLARARAQIELRHLYRDSLAHQALSLHTEKLTAVAQLSATLAHELNTPAQYLSDNLTFLNQAFSALLPAAQQDGVLPMRGDLQYLRDELPKSLSDMREGVQRIATIVQAIREFAELDENRITSVDLPKTIDTVVELLRSRWLGVVDMTTHHAPDVRNLRCGPADLKHALWQVIAQAIDGAGREGDGKGSVDIATHRELGHVYISVRSRPARRSSRETLPPPDPEPLRLTRAVMQKHRAELLQTAGENGLTTAVIKLPESAAGPSQR
jgi:two-component system, NtrC family, sensor kinase